MDGYHGIMIRILYCWVPWCDGYHVILRDLCNGGGDICCWIPGIAVIIPLDSRYGVSGIILMYPMLIDSAESQGKMVMV
jgi:hypothetical protein